MFEYIEKKKEAKNKKVTVRFNDAEYEAMNRYINDENNDVRSLTELVRKALGNLIIVEE